MPLNKAIISFYEKVCKIPKCLDIPFQTLRCIWGNIFVWVFFFFVIVFFVETKEGEHIRRKCTVPSAMTSNCMIGDVEYKLSQYADDTSLISEGSPLILDGILRKLDFSKNILS